MEEVVSQQDRSESWRDIVSILCIAYLTPVAAIPVWLISRWSNITKWVVTAISIIALFALYFASFSGYKFSKFQKAYSPVLEVQQALDIYGIEKGKYPDSLDDLKGGVLSDLPNLEMQYLKTEDGKSYTLRARIDGKNVELGPVLKKN